MSTGTFALDEEMAAGLQQAASELGLSPAQLAEKAIRRYLREEAENKIDREEEQFRRQHAQLLEKYGNSYIAMHNGEVIDTDVDELALFMRVRQKYPLIGVLIKWVGVEDDDLDTSDIPPSTDEQLAKMRPLREVFPELVREREQIVVALEDDVAAWVQRKAQQSAQSDETIVNMALRAYIAQQRESLEDTLRRVIREELKATG